MCDQSEIAYLPKEIVWVKLGPVWWPGEVQDYNALPEEITKNLRKKPIAVVKFFQEDSYEYIKNLNCIYRYNCLKKNDFIKKGLDLCRSANSRDVPSNMKMFPADVVTAEKRTGGDPNILQSELFVPQEKKNYTELFTTPKKSTKEGTSSGRRGRPPAETKANAKSFLTPPVPVATPSPRSITHPRFVGRSNTPDYETHVRQQPPPDSETPPPNMYRCHVCDFSTIRLNVIVLHNKSHTGTNVDFSPKDKGIVSKKFTPKIKAPSTPKVKQTETLKRKLVAETPSPSVVKRANITVTVKKEVEKQSPSSAAEPTPLPEPKPVAKKRGPKSTKTERMAKIMKENEAIRDDLLKDWDEEDEMAEEEEKCKSFEDKSFSEDASFSENKDEAEDKKTEAKEVEDKKTETKVIEGTKSETKGIEAEKPKEKSCFDFDESDDSIITNEKPISFSRKSSTGPDATASEKKTDTEVEEFGKKVEDLLNETVVPELPDLKLPGADPKKPPKPFEFGESPKSNELESKSVDSSQAEGSVPTAETADKITDSDQNSGGVQESQPETTEPKNEPKLEESEFEVRSPQSTNSLVIDFDAKPIRQRRRSSQPKPKSPVATEGRPKRTTSSTVTSSGYVEISETKTRRASNASVSLPAKNVKTEMISKPETATVEEIVADQAVPLKMEPADSVSSSSDRITADLVPTIKKEYWSVNELSVGSPVEEVKTATKAGGRRGRPPGKIIVAKPITPRPTVTSTRRRSASRKADTIVPTSLIGQEIEVNSSPMLNIGQERLLKRVPRGTSLPAEIISTESQFSEVKVLSEPVVTETIVVGGEYILNPDQPGKVNSNENSAVTNYNLDFDINSMPIEIDNNEYAPSSLGYEKIETVQTISSSTPIEIAPPTPPVPPASLASFKVEPKTVKSPSSFLEKALISNEKALTAAKMKSTVAAVPKKVATKAEKGAATGVGSKLVMPAQTPGGSTKMRTVKLPSGAKFLQNPKSSNQFLLLKTSTGQQLLKSSQLLQQPDGRMIIVTQNQSPRSGLTVKGMKTEQFPTGKITTSRLITTKGIVSSSGSDAEGASSSKQMPNILSKIGESSKSKPVAVQGGARQKMLGKVSVSNSVNLSQANIPGNKIYLPGKQGGISKVFLSKASGAAGAKYVMHTSPTKVSLPPNFKQKLALPGTSPGSILVPSPVQASKASTVPMQTAASKVVVSQVSSPVSFPTVSKIVKVQKQGPNILQKPQRKSAKLVATAVASKVAASSGTVLPSVSSSLPPGPVETVLPSTSVGVVPNSSPAASNVVYVAMDNNTYQAVDSSMLSFDASQQPTQTLYINPGSTNLENILLTIDEKGNFNLAPQPPQLFTSEVATPTQDILAKALADTQVLQTEASIAEATSRVAYIESLPYPATPLISNVHETSLTLNQPIMTPLEVPSSATPNFNLIPEQATKAVKSTSQDMFITQIPGMPSSSVAYQITVDENLVAASSAGLNQPRSDSVETNIDEDLIKINKPFKPLKSLIKTGNSVRVEPTIDRTGAPIVGGMVEPIARQTAERMVEPVIEQRDESIVEQTVESTVEQTFESTVEQAVESTVEQTFEPIVEQTVETFEPTVEETVEETIEETVEETVGPTFEQTVESAVAQTVVPIEQTIEPTGEETVEQIVEETVEPAVKESVVEMVEETVEPAVEETVVVPTVEETIVMPTVEKTNEPTVEETIEPTVEKTIESTIEETIVETIEETVEESYLTETPALENKVEIDSSQFVISESTISDNSVQSNFIDAQETSTEVLPKMPPVSSNGEMEVVQKSEANVANNCDTMKDDVVESSFIVETEVVNGLNANYGDDGSATKVTKDLNFPCQESEKIPDEVPSAPSENIIHEV